MPSHPSVVLNDRTFAWPDGALAIDGLTGVFGRGRTGLIGANGAGKSTLLRLIAGRLKPTNGSIAVTGAVDYLPQHLTLAADATLGELLGVRAVVDAVRAVTARAAADPRRADEQPRPRLGRPAGRGARRLPRRAARGEP